MAGSRMSHLLYLAGITGGISTSTYWLSTALMNQITPLILVQLGISGYFYIITGINMFAFILVLLALPETKVGHHYMQD